MKARMLQRVQLRGATAAVARSRVAALVPVRAASSVSQRPNSEFVQFPGALKSAFTHSLNFENPESYKALPTYRVVDQHGVVVDSSFEPDIAEEQVVKLYKDMLFISIMDLIMFDAQRQGRLSFYMVSAGEEAVSVGTSSVLDPEDVVFCQYREQGLFKERGFTTKEFMSQLFSNRNDPGKGRNMPIHYGSKKLNVVRIFFLIKNLKCSKLTVDTAHNLITSSHAAAAGFRRGICSEATEDAEPRVQGSRLRRLLRRGCCQ